VKRYLRPFTFVRLLTERNQESGFSLLEILVALGIVAAVAVVFLLGMAVSSKGVIVSQQSVAVDNLAKAQMENVKCSPYDYANNPPNYTAAKLTSLPTSYGINITAQRINANPNNDPALDDGIQQITITVTRNGATVYTLVGYKVNRLQ
jgi:prepilin-type N-terminal cleavage/methylation domain-containing protein